VWPRCAPWHACAPAPAPSCCCCHCLRLSSGQSGLPINIASCKARRVSQWKGRSVERVV
jgi:hypothetical protein